MNLFGISFVLFYLKLSVGHGLSVVVSLFWWAYLYKYSVFDRLELKTFEVMFEGKNVICFDDLLQSMQSLPREEMKLVGNVVKICKLLAVNPATRATAERTFSMARR